MIVVTCLGCNEKVNINSRHFLDMNGVKLLVCSSQCILKAKRRLKK